ncbi:endonuclease domain-containing protein [Spirosoma foliorum]|uniref:Endonuclease domain-containing protein n=1 Tax=Spirosoma foliorum TaxID=2710596 RepID=A0A7G5GTX0_9BACT|nr:endonuclease domain-containing protein [Spirosoma foliorum]QMW02312.1 endonuclease domain-containing protein [Spirosoma foliorum]
MGQLIHNRKAIEVFRRELRKNPTPFESLLWDRLRGSQLDGRKFRRQHSVGVYILDFYCPMERLCVEIDGSVHTNNDAILHDKDRDAALTQLQIRTLRISNAEIETDIEATLTKIKACFNN